MMDYVLFGIQGSGKGTQAKILAEKINAAYFETGGELRRLSGEDSELGRKIKSIIEAGRLVPNEVVMEIVENFINRTLVEKFPKNPAEKNASAPNTAATDVSIIFDGLPRNQQQSDAFVAHLNHHNRPFSGLYFELSREIAEKRLLTRRTCKNCKTIFPAMYTQKACEKCGGELVTRADDNADAINTRIEIFYKETLPVIEKWRAQNRMISINADQSIEAVTNEMLRNL